MSDATGGGEETAPVWAGAARSREPKEARDVREAYANQSEMVPAPDFITQYDPRYCGEMADWPPKSRCAKMSVAVRIDTEGGGTYPVCEAHVEPPMLPLAALIDDAIGPFTKTLDDALAEMGITNNPYD